MARRPLIHTAEGTHREAFAIRDWVLLAIPGAIWGSSFFFIAEALEDFSPAMITFLRIALGFLALGVVPASRVRIDRADWPRVVLLGVVWMAFPLSMFPIAEQHVSSSLTGMLNGATPIFVAAVATILLRRLPGPAQLGGLAVGFAGVVLIAIPSFGEGSSEIGGVVMILAALSCYGLAINLAVPLQQSYGSLPVIWRAQAVAMLLTAPFAVPGVDDVTFSWAGWLSVLCLGVLGTGLAFALASDLAGRVGATRASVTVYITPIVAILLGVVVRDEPLAALSLAGSAVVLVGAWLSGRAEPAPAEAPAPTLPVSPDV
jgi:drug/metabolite transporter (DMT)-like permease